MTKLQSCCQTVVHTLIQSLWANPGSGITAVKFIEVTPQRD